MSDTWQSMQASLGKAQQRFVDAVRSGCGYVSSMISRLPLLAAVEAKPSGSDVLRDETHYWLVPFHESDTGYALYTARLLPDGYGPANDLPRLRVFHLPAPGGERVLEQMVIEEQTQAAGAAETENEQQQDISDRLQHIADEIDRKSQYVTGGLLVIGGVVALANPLIGVGIAAKALLPSIGGVLTREGLRHTASRLKSWRRGREEAARRKQVTDEVKSVELAVVVNPVLAMLEKALVTDGFQYNPVLEFDSSTFELDGWPSARLLRHTAAAVTAVYAEVLPDPGRHAAADLGPEDVCWLQMLQSLGDDA